jgi:predicted ATPase/class 3 adenylate cyclase/DNA-binding CsgD family transcriptional regulator
MSQLPTGTVTLLFTDIEGSTLLLQQLGERYADIVATCRQLLRTAFQQWNGFEVDTQGDAFFVVFARASDAISAVVDMQRAISSYSWPSGAVVALRIGLHTGEPTRTAEGYLGLDVHHAARIMSAGHGGQVLLSQTTRELVQHNLPDGASLRDLGEHRLKDLQRPCHIYQLIIEDLPADFPPLKTLDNSPNNLPIQATSLIGREKELAALLNLLQREEVRLLTLTGPGGTGKTRLGLQMAAELIDLFPDGVYFVNLAPINDSELAVPTLAQTFDIKETAEKPLLDMLKASLHWKHLLLLLDNFEQVVGAAVYVADLLATCPKLKVMVTSRTVLHVRGEQEFPVPPLAVPDPTHLPDLVKLSQYEAVALFIQRAQAVKPEFQVKNTNAPAVAEICVRLDGLPLAIELAAARIKLLPPQALLARLGQRLAVLTGGAKDVPARQQTLRNTIEWSYQLLDAQEQQLFRRLSAFVGGCTLEAIEAICNALDNNNAAVSVLDGVASLIDKSLLQQTEQEGEEPRLVMLETVREYGLEALETSGEMEVTRQAHALYNLAMAEKAEPELGGPQQAVWLERLEREHENLRAALLWSLEHEKAETGLRLAGALHWFWMRRSYLSEGRKWLTSILELAEGVKPTHLRAKALAGAIGLAWLQGDYSVARALGEESVRLCRALENKRELAFSLMWLSFTTGSQGDQKTASVLAEESVTLFRQVQDRWGVAFALFCLAIATSNLHDYSLARSFYEESLALFRVSGDTWGVALSLVGLGVAAFAQGDYAVAHPLLEEGVVLLRAQRDKRDLALFMYYLGRLTRHEGDYQQAVALFEESLELYEELGHKPGIARVLCILGKMACDKGDYGQAGVQLKESLALMQESKSKRGIASVLEGFAKLTAAQQQAELAARLLGAAEVLREAIGAHLPLDERDDYDQAVAATRKALGEEAFARAWAKGRAMPLEQVLAAQGAVERPTPPSIEPPSPPPAKTASTYTAGLTAREVEVLHLVAQGLTDAQVAKKLVISPRTVNFHLTSIYGKIGVSSRSAATRYAIEHHLV